MKIIYTIFLLLIGLISNAQIGNNNKISFTYDAAGNRVKRIVVEIFNPERKGIERDLALDSLIRIFPNPTADLLNIRLDNFKDTSSPIELLIIDISGRVIIKKTYTSPEATIDMQAYRAGNYFLILKRKEYTNTWKIIKNAGIN